MKRSLYIKILPVFAALLLSGCNKGGEDTIPSEYELTFGQPEFFCPGETQDIPYSLGPLSPDKIVAEVVPQGWSVEILSGSNTIRVVCSDEYPQGGKDGDAKIVVSGGRAAEKTYWITLDCLPVQWYHDDVVAASAFGGGDGTSADNAYEISEAGELRKLIDDVKAGNTYSNQYFKLTEDFKITSTKWLPIGTVDNPFMGAFDGNGKIRYGRIHSDEQKALGVFGAAKGSLSNITVEANVINGLKTKEKNVNIDTGGIVGSFSGVISGCKFTGTVSGGGIDAAEPSWSNTGGIVGRCSDSEISGCEVGGTVTGGSAGEYDFTCTGGVVGVTSNTNLLDCLNKAVVNAGAGNSAVGGIVSVFGEGAAVSLHKCANSGEIRNPKSARLINAGGVVGECYGAIYSCCTNSAKVLGNKPIKENDFWRVGLLFSNGTTPECEEHGGLEEA